MPLVVPALRFFVVFLNVYETFKTLKPPPPSARRGGQPSVRAITQRKRDLKGCLAVWVVWCCYAVYERTFDRVVGLFLPFYSEIKSVFLLFLVLTRAKGAEPLFLHVVRPFVKPYIVVVDPILEFSRDIGDFLFALLQVPLEYTLSLPWFSFWRTEELEDEPDKLRCTGSANSASPTRANSHSKILISVNHSAVVRPFANERHGSVRSFSDNHRSDSRSVVHNPSDSRGSRDPHPESTSTTSLPAYSEHPYLDPPRYSRTLSRYNGQQIWYPPISAYSPSSQDALTLDHTESAPEYHSSEWRTYPAFPSAYPPTPLPPSASLPTSATWRSDSERRVVSDPAYLPIPEGEQSFDELVGEQHRGRLGSVQSSSNSHTIHTEVNGYESGRDAIRHDEDTLLDDSMCSSEAGLSEDDFDTPLRTPLRPPQAMPSGAYSSADSLTSSLTTTNNSGSLRAKMSSDSSSSGSSSLAGRKRGHGTIQGNARNTLPKSQSRNATLRGRPLAIPQDPLESSSSEGEDESGFADDDGTHAKRQRVLDPLKRKSTVRPAPRGLGGTRKVIPSRSGTRSRAVVTASQATLRSRTGSASSNNSTIKGRKSTLVSRQVLRDEPLGIIKSASTSSSRSGTLKGRGL